MQQFYSQVKYSLGGGDCPAQENVWARAECKTNQTNDEDTRSCHLQATDQPYVCTYTYTAKEIDLCSKQRGFLTKTFKKKKNAISN